MAAALLMACGAPEAQPKAPPDRAQSVGLSLSETPYTCFTVADTVELTRELNRRTKDGYGLVAIGGTRDSGGGIHACVYKPEEKKPKRPSPPPLKTVRRTGGPTGIPSCDLYIQTVERYVQCDKVPPQARDATRKGIEQMREAWLDIPADARQAASDGCKQAISALRKGADALGCKL